MTFLYIYLILNISDARPVEGKSSSRGGLRLKKTDCIKIQNLKKSVYKYLESKLTNLNSSQQELLAKKLIAKLNRRLYHHSHGPWTGNGEMFARILK